MATDEVPGRRSVWVVVATGPSLPGTGVWVSTTADGTRDVLAGLGLSDRELQSHLGLFGFFHRARGLTVEVFRREVGP